MQGELTYKDLEPGSAPLPASGESDNWFAYLGGCSGWVMSGVLPLLALQGLEWMGRSNSPLACKFVELLFKLGRLKLDQNADSGSVLQQPILPSSCCKNSRDGTSSSFYRRRVP